MARIPRYQRKPREQLLRPLYPNEGVRAIYFKKLDALIRQMDAEPVRRVRGGYPH